MLTYSYMHLIDYTLSIWHAVALKSIYFEARRLFFYIVLSSNEYQWEYVRITSQTRCSYFARRLQLSYFQAIFITAGNDHLKLTKDVWPLSTSTIKY